MKSRVQSLRTAGLACALIFASMNLFAQQGARQGRVPVGPPGFIGNEPFSVPNGPLPAVNPPVAQPFLTLQIGQSYDGIDFLGSNCGCLPPDTNAAVGNNFVVETVNVQVRIFDKITGAVLLDEPLSALFGA